MSFPGWKVPSVGITGNDANDKIVSKRMKCRRTISKWARVCESDASTNGRRNLWWRGTGITVWSTGFDEGAAHCCWASEWQWMCCARVMNGVPAEVPLKSC